MKTTKKQRKYGRNAAYCLGYKNSNRREKNKIMKLENHLKGFPNDATSKAAVDACKKIISGR